VGQAGVPLGVILRVVSEALAAPFRRSAEEHQILCKSQKLFKF